MCLSKSTRGLPWLSSHAVTFTVTGDVAFVQGLSHSLLPYELVTLQSDPAGNTSELPCPRLNVVTRDGSIVMLNRIVSNAVRLCVEPSVTTGVGSLIGCGAVALSLQAASPAASAKRTT